MGFNGCILPSIDSMIREIELDGLEVFVKRFSKYDSIMGDSDRIEFLEEKIKEYNEKLNYTPII